MSAFVLKGGEIRGQNNIKLIVQHNSLYTSIIDFSRNKNNCVSWKNLLQQVDGG